jgi:hypothetical protein
MRRPSTNLSRKNIFRVIVGLFILVGAILGLIAFILHFTKKRQSEEYKNSKSTCNIDYKVCPLLPKPEKVENLDPLKNVWKAGKYKFTCTRQPSKKYLTSKTDGVLEIKYEDNKVITLLNEVRNWEDGKQHLAREIIDTLGFDGIIRSQMSDTSGSTRDGFYVNFSKDEIAIFYKARSSVLDKEIYYLEVNKRKGNDIEAITYKSDDLTKQWILEYKQIFSKINNKL